MRLIVVNDSKPSELGAQWLSALLPIRIRYPHPSATVECVLDVSACLLSLRVDQAPDTLDLSRSRGSLAIASVQLACWPGVLAARAWIAAAFAGYLQHEALELVTCGNTWPLDPHAEPYPHAPCNRGLREGLPSTLDEPALIRALATVMDESGARALVAESTR